jgi:hypothetical protein
MVFFAANCNDDNIDGEQNWRIFESDSRTEHDARHPNVVMCLHGIPNRCVSVFVLCSSRVSSIGRSLRCERGMCMFARSACIQLLLMSPSTKLFCNVEFSSLRAKFRYWTIRNRWCKRTRLLITAYVHGRQSKCLFAILASAYIHSGERERGTRRKKSTCASSFVSLGSQHSIGSFAFFLFF